MSQRFEGITTFQPFPLKHFDLIHAFNRIPTGTKPYVIGFESHLPRGFWFENSAWYKMMRRSLVSDRCRAIVPISRHAELIFRHKHADHPDYETLASKVTVRLPNIFAPPVVKTSEDILEAEEVRLVFVGSHFARKGGCVAVRMAELAAARGFPLKLEVISDLSCGGAIWTDPCSTDFFRPYLDKLDMSNVVLRKGASNLDVLAAMQTAHFSILTTFSDTFGFSAIESMINSAPVIGTRQGALPEFIDDGVNGILLDLPVTSLGEWIYSAHPHRDTAKFEATYRDEIERMATQALDKVIDLWGDRPRYARMRAAARRTAETLFSGDEAAVFWDDLYVKALS